MIVPTGELIRVLKTVQKTMEKRNRKRLDYDRHNGTLQAISHKTERSMNDEKKLRQVRQSVASRSDIAPTLLTCIGYCSRRRSTRPRPPMCSSTSIPY